MNRRITVKKNNFSFLSDLYDSRNVRIGLNLTAGSVVFLLCGLVISAIDLDASAIIGVFALVTIPLIVLAALLFGLEKVTGISCLSGVEWIGKNTLFFFDWIMFKIFIYVGIEAGSNKHPAMQPDAILNHSRSAKSKMTELDTRSTHTEAAVLDFESITAGDQLLDSQDYKRKLFSETVESNLSAKENVAEEKLIINKQDKVFFDPDSVELIDHKNKIEHKDDLTSLSVDELQIIEEIDNPSIISSTAILSELIEEPSFFDADFDEQIDGLNVNGKDDVLTTVIPELEIDDVELEIKSLFEEVEDWQENESITRSENELQGEAGLDEPANIEQSRVELDLSVKSTFAEGENDGFDSEGVGNSVNNMSDIPPQVTGEDIDQPPISIDPTGSVLTEIENNASHPSMLSQAEQTAANILSSFTAKFSRPSEKLSRSFSLSSDPEFQIPSTDLLQRHERSVKSYSTDKLEEMSRSVERVLKDYKVLVEVVGAYPGPIITRFELSLAPGVKVSRVSGLAKDLARAMLVTSVRVVEIIEGTPYIGLEIPNKARELVSFLEIIASEKFQQAKSPLTLALGKDVSGHTVVSDLAKMPHLLVAGTTGSGKSVAINTMILSMLYKSTPDQVRMIMIDPKMLELSVYEGIPHLLTPVVTDMKEAQNALRWAVAEMERRYKLMSKVGVRNLAGFNQKIEDATARGETIRDPLFQLIEPLQEGETFPVLSTLPSIVIVIDELADMMMIVGKKVEELIARLAQKARAAGIHLVLATQRPSVDVLTGLIKANVPTRISFQVSSRIDSRTILDQGGAEALLGNGDMLFLPSGTSVPVRSHGAFVGDDEVHAVVNYLKTQGCTSYLTEITQDQPVENAANPEATSDEVDALYHEAVSLVLETGRASISSVQRRFKVGYNRAARMIDQMEEEGIVSEPEGNGSRRVLNREE